MLIMLNIVCTLLFCSLFIYIQYRIGKYVESTMTEREKNDQTIVDAEGSMEVPRSIPQAQLTFEQRCSQYFMLFFMLFFGSVFVIVQLIHYFIYNSWINF